MNRATPWGLPWPAHSGFGFRRYGHPSPIDAPRKGAQQRRRLGRELRASPMNDDTSVGEGWSARPREKRKEAAKRKEQRDTESR
jgi:hypothetical protein